MPLAGVLRARYVMDQSRFTKPAGEHDVISELEMRLRADPRIDYAEARFTLTLEGDTLELSGEVPSIAAKRVATAHAASIAGIAWVVDKLRVRPAELMTDAQIRDHLLHSLQRDSTFDDCTIREWVKGEDVEVRSTPRRPRGEIRVFVRDGVVELDGEVPTRAHARLAVLLAWWVPGSRDVIDGLGILSRERDSDDELEDAVRIALEKDPLIDATQVGVRAHEGVVTLTGLLTSDAQRHMAAFDAWCLPGVRDVADRIHVGG